MLARLGSSRPACGVGCPDDPRRAHARRVRLLQRRVEHSERGLADPQLGHGRRRVAQALRRNRRRDARRGRRAHLPPGRSRPRRRRGRWPRRALFRTRRGDLRRRCRCRAGDARRPAGEQIARVDIIKAGHVFASAGTGPAIAPVRGAVPGTDASFVLSVQADDSYTKRDPSGDRRGDPAALRHIGSLRRAPARRNDPRPTTRPTYPRAERSNIKTRNTRRPRLPARCSPPGPCGSS